MTDLKPCPACNAMCKVETIHSTSAGCYKLYTRHVTPDERIKDEKAKAYEFLVELYAQVKGECPSLLNEDSGGDAELDYSIKSIMKQIEQLKKETGV